MENSRTMHASNSYLVLANDRGVEVTDLHTGDAIFFTGADARDTLAELAMLGLEERDRYLSGYFEE